MLGNLAAKAVQQVIAAQAVEDNVACMIVNQNVEAAPAPHVSKEPVLASRGRPRSNCAYDAFPDRAAPIVQFDCQSVDHNLDEVEQMLVQHIEVEQKRRLTHVVEAQDWYDDLAALRAFCRRAELAQSAHWTALEVLQQLGVHLGALQQRSHFWDPAAVFEQEVVLAMVETVLQFGLA